MKSKLYLTFFVSLLFMLAIFLMSCESGYAEHIEDAEFFLKRAYDQSGDLRRELDVKGYIPEDYDEILMTLRDIEDDIEDALQELYYTHPNY